MLITTQKAEVIRHRDAWQSLTVEDTSTSGNSEQVYTFDSLSSALHWLGRGDVPAHNPSSDYDSLPKDIYLQVFVSGSLYLVGNSFHVLQEPVG